MAHKEAQLMRLFARRIGMKTSTRSLFKRLKVGQFLAAVPFVLSFALALISGLILFSGSIFNGLVNAVIATGFDLLRAQLIAALLMAMASAFIGALFVRRRLGAILGAGIIFCSAYLLGFIQLELLPVHDAGGHLEPLNMGALVNTSLVMLALGLLAAFCGAAIGVAMGEVIFEPVNALRRFFRQRVAAQNQYSARMGEEGGRRPLLFKVVYTWLGLIVMIVLLVLASSSSNLFLFSPDIGLHNPPEIPRTPGSGIPAHGTIIQDSLISRALGGRRRTFLIYLPPSYSTSPGKTKRYPVLYLLHGSPGSQHDWFTAGKAQQSADTLIALGQIPELIMVSPDGNGFERGTSEWGNSFDQRQLMETFVARDLVQYVDAKYRTIPKAAYRGIAGLSMGGFGAANIGVHHPDVFGFVISLGGYFRAEGIIWGNNATYKRENSPLDVLPTKKQTWKSHFYLADGTQDQPYYTDTIKFAQELARLHITYHLDQQNGHHSWTLWQIFLYKALLWLHWGTSQA
jgi:enterochelin esterase-like enzyme